MADSELIDPLGRKVVLHDHTWYGHIVKGHPEMRARRQEVEWTVEKPKEIRFSASDSNCRIYYGTDAVGLCVAVVADVAVGVVKTAYVARRPRGEVEWS